MGDLSGMDLITRLAPALAVVVLLPLGVLWLQRRRRGGNHQTIRMTSRAALGRNTWIAIVEVEGRRLLVATGEKGVNLLTELEPAPAVSEAAIDPDALLEGLTTATADNNDGPGTGLIRRLQERTLRKAPSPRGPQFELDA
jgi:flagellar biogenesis protein FliO